MRKKFTMLLMSLLAFVGVAKAETGDPITLADGVYAIQCAGNNKWAQYNGNDRILAGPTANPNVFDDSYSFTITKGEGNKYTIQTADGKYVTYKGTEKNDQIEISETAKWWVIREGNAAGRVTIVPDQDNIGNSTPGWNYAVKVGGVANAALGHWDCNDGNSQWTLRASNIKKDANGAYYNSLHIKVAGNYVSYVAGEEYLKKNNNELSRFTFTAGADGKYTIQTNDGKYLTYTAASNGDQIKIKDAADATDENKWWVVTYNYGTTQEYAVDIFPYQDGIAGNKPAFNWAVTVNGAVNSGLGFWDANDGGTYCVLERPIVDFTYDLKYLGETVATRTARGRVGDAFPEVADLPYGVSAVVPTGVVSYDNEGASVEVAVEYDLPFEFAATVDKIESWYYMQMKSNDLKYIKRVESELTWADADVNEDEKSSYAWAFVGDPFNGFKVVNEAAGIGSALLSTGNNADKVTLTTFDAATPLFVKATRVTVNGYMGFCLKPASGNYMNAQDGTVKHWGDNDEGSTIKVTKVAPKRTVTVTYMFNGAQVGEQTQAIAYEGTTYTFANAYADRFVTASCTANGADVEEVEGQWSVVVAGETSIVVTLAEANMPFNTTTITEGQFADDTEWYILKQKDENHVWAYVAEGHTYTEDDVEYTTNVKANAGAYNVYDEAQLWCFVGDAVNGVKIFNKAAGAAMSLDNAAPAKLVANNDKTWELHKSDKAFADTDSRFGLKRDGGYYANLQEKLYESGNYVLNGWNLDAGSTTKAISATAELSEIATLKTSLSELITKATALKALLAETSATTLDAAITAAREDKTSKDEVKAQITALTAAYEAARYITDLSQLRNDVGYTISTEARGTWYSDGDKNAVNGTQEMGAEYDVTNTNLQFAFLKSSTTGKYYLYSVALGEFVKAEGSYTTFTENAEEYVTLLESTGANKAAYPWVVELNGTKQVHMSPGYSPDAITTWNDKGDAGNMVRLEVAATFTLAQSIETYELNAVKAQLQAEMDEATTLAGEDYIGEAAKTALTAAVAAAQEVYNNGTYDEVVAQITTLGDAIDAAGYVTTVEGFSNAAIYTFLSNRNATAYMMYDGEHDFVASPFKNGDLATDAGEDNVNCQWAVYKSAEGNYYMYNLGAQKFMGLQTENNNGIPFSATPQTTTLTFKVSDVHSHPIMISPNGGAGAVNHSGNTTFVDNYGVVNWIGGWESTNDGGNVHKVKIVGALDQTTADAIAAAVAAFEKEDAKKKFELAISELEYCMTWLDAGYYRTTDAEALAKAENFYDWKANNLDSATPAEIKSQTAKVNELIATFSVVPPVAGKFYRISHDFGGEIGVQYIQAKPSGVDGLENALLMTEEKGAASIFYYAEGKLLSYSEGLYVNETGNSRGLQSVDTEVNTTIDFGVGTYFAEYTIKFGSYLHANKTDEGVCYVDHCSGNTCGEAHLFTVEEVTELPVKVGAAGYATFYAPVDMVIPNNVEASIISEITGNEVTLQAVTGVVPAGTGLILKGESGDYNFTVATEDPAADFNQGLLTGTTAKAWIAPDENVVNYVLSNNNGKVGLYKKTVLNTAGKIEFAANKAYLPVTLATDTPDAEAPAMFAFTRGEEGDDSTGIENVESNEELVIYDLAGRRVQKMEKGIYIVNGRKVVIK